jgi:hypothetical protein
MSRHLLEHAWRWWERCNFPRAFKHSGSACCPQDMNPLSNNDLHPTADTHHFMLCGRLGTAGDAGRQALRLRVRDGFMQVHRSEMIVLYGR